MTKKKARGASVSNKKQDTAANDKKSQHTKQFLAIVFTISCLLVFIGLFIAGFLFYANRALPNITLGSEQVGGIDKQAIRDIALKQQEKLQVSFVDGDKRPTVRAEELGVTIDIDATVQKVLDARRSGNIWQNIALWQTQNVPLVFKTDPGKAKDYIARNFPSYFVNAQDAQLQYNNDKQAFEIKSGSPGKGFDVAWFESQLPDWAANPRPLTLTLTTAPVEPLITADALQKPQEAINGEIKLPIILTLNGTTRYTATPADIAGWVHFIPDPVTGTSSISYDKAKIEQFLRQKVAPLIAQTPIDRKVIKSADGSETVITPGRAGQQISGVEDIANQIVGALQGKQGLTKELTITTAPFKTVTVTGSGHWLEVDLSLQRLTMWVDNTAINSFTISSGTARTPTPTGTFAVWSKNASQTMTGTIAGDYFYLPNVKWVSYINGDVAIHGTYWHNNFGTPMSHGCINMTEAAAKIVYDFAPIGTKVVVHN